MRDYITIGPVPAGEPCAQVGEQDYLEKSTKECKRFIKQLKKQFGQPPQNTSLQMKTFHHEFGMYHEVVCYYNTDDSEGEEYCLAIEAEMPEFWEVEE